MMPWFTFTATVDGDLEAESEEEAKMLIRIALGRMGSVDIEILEVEDESEFDTVQRPLRGGQNG